MAEGIAVVGLAAAIVQFVDFGSKIVGRLNEFNSDTDDVPKSFRVLKIQLPLIVDTLGRTRKQADAGCVSSTTANALKPMVDGCLEQVKLLEEILDKTIPSKKDSSWRKRIQALKSLAHDRTVQQIASALDRYVHSLTFHQTTSNLDLSSKMMNATLTMLPQKPIFMMPFDQDYDFVGRESILDEIKLRLNTRHRRVALAGIGGVGKSQLAIEYCYRYKAEHLQDHVFWVYSNNFTRFDQAYKEIARKLNLPGFEDPRVDILRVVAEYLNDSDCPWLMVLDNADDQELFFGPSSRTSPQGEQQQTKKLVDYLPRSSNGAILITTRDRRVGDRLAQREKLIVVLPFEAQDAKRLLRIRLPDDMDRSDEEEMELVTTLNYLPLAITQAAAYIDEEGVSIAHYLSLIQDDAEAKALLDQDYYEPARDSDVQNSIFQTWQISFNQITRQKPRAAEILSVMAVLDRHSITDSLLRHPDESKVAFDTAVGTLKAFSLITKEKEGSTYSMHRLVQLSTQIWLKLQGSLEEWQEIALDLISRCCPSDGSYDTWTAWEAISPHVQVVLGYRSAKDHCLLTRASILHRAADYERSRGRLVSALEKSREALTIRQHFLDLEHPDTLICLNNLALVLQAQGKYEEAKQMHRQGLELSKRIFGDEHIDTLTSTNNLALVLRYLGNYKEAEQMHRQELLLSKKVLGKEHPDTLLSMSNLATVLRHQGKKRGAEQLIRQTLKLCEKVLGQEHPDTLGSMTELGSVLHNKAKYKDAEQAYRQALVLREKVLGKEHPDTLTSMSNLASTLDSLGEYKEAEQIHRQTLRLKEKVLGKGHPATVASMHNLALVLDSQCKYKEAEQMYRQTIEMFREVLGEEHPSTLTSMKNLTVFLESQETLLESQEEEPEG